MDFRQALATVLSLLCAAGACAQHAPGHAYGLKEEQAPTGSRIRRDIATSKSIPMNLPYSQLSPQARAAFHQNYESIAPGDEPPFPLEGLKSILAPVSKAQAALLVQGDLFLVAQVDAAGVVQGVTAYGSPSDEMTRVAGQILLLTKFKPAVCAGQPCAMEFPLRLRLAVD